jgi:hypothetical protein
MEGDGLDDVLGVRRVRRISSVCRIVATVQIIHTFQNTSAGTIICRLFTPSCILDKEIKDI